MTTKFQITNPGSDYLKMKVNSEIGILAPGKKVVIEIGPGETVALKVSADTPIGALIGPKTRKRRKRRKKSDTLELKDEVGIEDQKVAAGMASRPRARRGYQV